MKKFFSNIYNIYLLFLGVLVSLPILAPLLLKLGLVLPAKIIYFIYSFFCHQFDSRSIHLYDYQFAWCSRDTAIWIGIFIAAILVKFNKLPRLKWYWVVLFIIPMGLDGGLQTVFTFLNLNVSGILAGAPIYISNNLSRFMTGAIFGIGVGWWLADQMKTQVALEKEKQEVKEEKNKFKHILASALMLVTMFFIYFGLVQLWNFSSEEIKPLNPLDSAVKTPTDNFFARRRDAICPTEDQSDLFALECFLR